MVVQEVVKKLVQEDVETIATMDVQEAVQEVVLIVKMAV